MIFPDSIVELFKFVVFMDGKSRVIHIVGHWTQLCLFLNGGLNSAIYILRSVKLRRFYASKCGCGQWSSDMSFAASSRSIVESSKTVSEAI